uniref:Putative DNA replication initiation protein n=1 Tax=viral metagenome TaxID=1070528 RepID=A0A6M3L0L2_9ZZZZ
MANPQAENGHVDIANEILDALVRTRIPGEARQCLDFILRKTWGWKKKEDFISLSQFAIATGINRKAVHRAITLLSSKKMIVVIKNDDSYINKYRFNKNFEEWEVSSKKMTLSSKKIPSVIKNDERVSSKKVHTKDNITKDTITKDKYSSPIPQDFLTYWAAYPKKIGKQAAIKAWVIAAKKGILPPIDQILKAIETQKQDDQWCKDGGQYIPHPATWINQGRWDDQPIPWQEKVRMTK